MKIIPLIFKPILKEVIIIFIFIILIYTYIGPVQQTIKSDATGYYDYLPSIFMYHDLIRKDKPVSKDSMLYKRIDSLGLYKDYGDFKVNKYACGTAVLQLPFFACAYLLTAPEGNFNDGYQEPFQKAIFYAAIFYLFLSIFFLRKILELYDIKRNVIIISQILLVFATTVTNYANYDAGFSHIYSLFAITAFIYFVKSYLINNNLNHFILACIFYGLILILRQINFVVILFVPFLAGSIALLKDGFFHLIRNPKIFLIGIFIITGIFFTQCLAWYLQVGKFIIYSYQGESFDFYHPHFFDILFSYRKGLFLYSPILFISVLSLFWIGHKRQYYLVLTWTVFFVLLTYILSSWYCWYYGGSYGMRAFIEYYAIFFIIFALLLNGISMVMKRAIIILSFLTIPLNIIQTYQYKQFILKWDGMNKEMYWEVFLKTSRRFKGLVWKKHYNYNKFLTVSEFLIGDINISGNKDTLIYEGNSKAIPEFENINIIQVMIDNEYNSNDDSQILLSLNNSTGTRHYCWINRYLIHFSEKRLNEWQTGLYNFEIPKISDPEEKIIRLEMMARSQNNILKDVKIRYLKDR